MGEGVSLADVMALTRGNCGCGCCGNDRNGMWGNDGFMEIFFLFFLLAWGGGGMFGGNGWGGGNAGLQGALTRADLTQGFDNQTVVNKLDGISHGICDSTYALNNGIRDNGMPMLQGFGDISRQLAQNGYEAQSCCCQTQRAIDQVRFDGERNTCDITRAIHEEAEATRALINANAMQDLRDKLEARDRDVMVRDFQLSQQAQNATLINAIRPFPQPAYITCSPYTSMYQGNGCGCGCATNTCAFA